MLSIFWYSLDNPIISNKFLREHLYGKSFLDAFFELDFFQPKRGLVISPAEATFIEKLATLLIK